ncbi:MAG: EF-P lysine aminoacylase GenX [Gammaproteobacteria bacterium]|nr:EF-P lysine aminoacylase GenX [Gammaproteobacteria bacterium]MCK5262792.1 EF-P lysine aminoacylase GenX [Gammaproteobacteria bacterium]
MENNNWQPSASLEIIKQKARMLKDIRAFFDDRDVLEVDTPLLASAGNTDLHIESLKTIFRNQDYYLNTSPEFAMKRLLAAHGESIYQICKAFRDEELGPMHNPEFTMLEWYRPGFDMHQLMDEVEALVLSVDDHTGAHLGSFERLSYGLAFERYADLDPYQATAEDCRECALQHDIEQPVGLDDKKDEWLDWLLTQLVLPSLPSDKFTFIYEYPASQCALARLRKNDDGVVVASRFELFYGETELANGFHELAVAGEQRQRFENENETRISENKPTVKIDENLLAALEHGLPDCSGVALGLDRLLMILINSSLIAEVLTFPWERA